MAIRFRKLLLPYLTSTTNDTNTLPCTDFCDPSCVDFDECYTFPAGPGTLPPLPPPLPIPPTTTIVATPSSTTNDSLHVSPLMIVVIIVLAGAFLLVSYYAIVIKYCSFWTRFLARRDLRRMPQPVPLADPHEAEDRLDMINQHDPVPVVDHPIWLITTVGLHQSVINSITVIRYKKEDGLIDGTDCSVCLSEFQEGETLRLLPKCKHAFHIDCIDTWLRSHTNCPMCRACIVANPGRPSMGSTEPSLVSSRRIEFDPMAHPMADSDSSETELGSGQTENINVSLVSESRGEAEDYEVEIAVDQNKFENENNPVELLVRRSYSMDYRNVSAPYLQQNSNSNSNSSALMASSSSRPQPPRVRVLKRSYSWSERVYWSARNQNHRNSDISP